MTAGALALHDVLRERASQYAQRPAVTQDGTTLTHAQVWNRCLRLANGLAQRGVVPGDRISIVAPNSPAFIELLGAASLLGAVLAPVNWRLSPAEVRQVLAADSPRIAFVHTSLLSLVEQGAKPAAGWFALDAHNGHAGGYAALLAGEPLPLDRAARRDALLHIHTAWTDGRPKAAVLSHTNLLSAALQLSHAWRLGVDDVHFCVLPLFHITAMSLALATMLAGGHNVLAAKFDPATAVETIARHCATLFGEFAPMLQAMLDVPGAAARLASVRHVCGLDAPQTITRFHGECPGATFWTGFGQSEATGMVTMAPQRDAQGSAGVPLPLVAVEIVDESGVALPPGETGEITVRGPTVFLGYADLPEASAHALRGGVLHTGDAGRLDEAGRMHYLGRLPEKALIKSGGENVYPAEVEAVLRQHPDVVDAVVIGVPDAKWGEAVRAVCVTHAAVAEDALIAFVGERIAAFKRPRSVVFAHALPRAAHGGIDRAAVQARYGQA